jgi:hypothetical protein
MVGLVVELVVVPGQPVRLVQALARLVMVAVAVVVLMDRTVVLVEMEGHPEGPVVVEADAIQPSLLGQEAAVRVVKCTS